MAVTKTDLADLYRNYIGCLNRQDWPKLGQFVHHDVVHNGRGVGLSGYLEMLERDFEEIPDLYFNIEMLIADPPCVASRLGFDCTPKGTFLPWPPRRRQEGCVQRERFLRVPERQDSRSMVCDRQGGYRSSALVDL